MKEFLKKMYDQKRNYTQNEITILMEAASNPFSREDLLKDKVYSPAPLTRTIKKLLDKGLLIQSYDAKKKKIYSLEGGAIDFKEKSSLIKQIARSKVITLNSLRVSAFLLCNDNKLSSARYIARNLEMDVEYLVNTVLPRMCVLNLLVREALTIENRENMEKEDIEIINTNNNLPLTGFLLNINWESNNKERWL